MKKWSSGDRVRVIERKVTEEDRKKNRYFEHMAGLVGTVETVYGEDEVAVQVDPDSLSQVSAGIHKTAVERMRERFLSNISEEQKKQLTKDELNFDAHYVVLLQSSDLESL